MRSLTTYTLLISFALGQATSFGATPEKQKSVKKRIESEELEIPKTPKSSPDLTIGNPPAEDSFRCPRRVIYRGKTMNCDSNLSWDGENLRPLMQNVPEALSELELYQKNRRKAENLRYVGAAGALLILMGLIVPNFVENKLPYRRVGLLGGGSIAIGSFVWGQLLLNHNENHLGRAMSAYNQANPLDPIELQFSTGVSF